MRSPCVETPERHETEPTQPYRQPRAQKRRRQLKKSRPPHQPAAQIASATPLNRLFTACLLSPWDRSLRTGGLPHLGLGSRAKTPNSATARKPIKAMLSSTA